MINVCGTVPQCDTSHRWDSPRGQVLSSHGVTEDTELGTENSFHPRAEPQRAQSDAQRICIIKELVRMPGDVKSLGIFIL